MMVELEEKPVVCNTCQVLMVRLDGMLACIDLSSVERTLALAAMQAMPGCAPYVAGIMNYAGNSLAVIDLAIRLGLPSSPYTLDTVVMICVHDGQRIGVIVQDIVGVQDLHEQDRQLTRELARYGAAFRASAHTDLGLALLLDAAWLTQAGLYPLVQHSDD